MKKLTTKLLKRFLDLAARRLDGEWVLMGGTVLPVLGCDYRSTTDIDFAPVGAQTNEQTIQVMEICEELGLPVETINSAGGFFLKKISKFKDHLVLLRAEKARIYRPSAGLFVQLKLARLSESDLQDCLEMLKLKGSELTDSERSHILMQVRRIAAQVVGEPKEPRVAVLLEALKR